MTLGTARGPSRTSGPRSRLRVAASRFFTTKQLPPQWHGKVHALHLAASAATGEWILATDADMVLHPSILRVAMSCALERGVQFLSIIPELEFGSFWEKVVLPGFSFLITSLFPVHLVNDPTSSRALAAGAFILMKREDLVALGGYARLKNVLIEDLRMAELFKRHGRRIYLAASRGLLHTRMYTSGAEIFEGLSRTAFEGSGFSIPKMLGAMFLANLLAVFPWVAVIARVLADWRLDRAVLHDPFLLIAVLACLIGFFGLLAFHPPLASSGSVRSYAAPGDTVLFLCVHLFDLDQQDWARCFVERQALPRSGRIAGASLHFSNSQARILFAEQGRRVLKSLKFEI